jgi:ubiquinone/menaquinone biosynthesis C-methylase UbiE
MSKERNLISGGIERTGGVWADFGSGTGIFTRELRGLLGPTSTLYSIERKAHDLDEQQRSMAALYPRTDIHYLQADFTQQLSLPPLDGILMANALHFVRFEQQAAVLARIAAYLRRPGGRFILVEYNARSGNPWVPYPIDLEAFKLLAEQAGLAEPVMLAAFPSRFMREMYAALALRP